MSPCDFRHLFQVGGKGEFFEHDDGLDHVLIDLVALLVGEGAPADGEVVDLAAVIEVFGGVDLKSPGVVRGKAVAVAAGCISRGELGCQRVRVRSGKVVAGATARLMISTLIVCHVYRHPNSFFGVAIEQE